MTQILTCRIIHKLHATMLIVAVIIVVSLTVYTQYTISLRKHPFLLALRRWGRFAKRPKRRRARRNGCFRRLVYDRTQKIKKSNLL